MDGDFVSTDWLAANLGNPDLAIVDCTMFMPGTGRDAASEFREAHIPGARFLDVEAVSDPGHPAPHMLPGAKEFGAAMEALGVGKNERIVVYDNSPIHTAPRGWFMLRHFGARNVAVLDGGMGKWCAEGRPIEQGEALPRPGRSFRALKARDEVVTKAMLLSGLPLPIADARSAARYSGADPDPRPAVASGHIPGARNIPMTALYQPDGTFADEADIRAAFASAGIDPEAPFVASCGSGVTANSIILAARKLGGGKGAKLYDGSWSEWGADPATPKAVGDRISGG